MNKIEQFTLRFPRLNDYLRIKISPESMKRIPSLMVKIAVMGGMVLGVRLFEQPQPRQELPQPPPDAIFITVEPSKVDIQEGDTVTVEIPPYDKLRDAGIQFLTVQVLSPITNAEGIVTGINYQRPDGTVESASVHEIVSFTTPTLGVSSN